MRLWVIDDDVTEGTTMHFRGRNLIGESEVIVQIIDDDTQQIAWERRFNPDGSGIIDALRGRFELTEQENVFQLSDQLLRVCQPDEGPDCELVNGFEVRFIHAGAVVATDRITVHAGFRAWVGAQNVREEHDFTIGVTGAKGGTAVYVDLFHDCHHDDPACQWHPFAHKNTRSDDGSLIVTYTMPKLSGLTAPSDRYRLRIRSFDPFDNEVERWFGITVYKANNPPPDTGGNAPTIDRLPPIRAADTSLAGLFYQKVLGATNDAIKSQVDAEIAADPFFIELVDATGSTKGTYWDAFKQTSRALATAVIGRTAYAAEPAIVQSLTPSIWPGLKNYFINLLKNLFDWDADNSYNTQDLAAVSGKQQTFYRFPVRSPHDATDDLLSYLKFGANNADIALGLGHLGQDFKVPFGEPVYAVANGTVTFSGDGGSCFEKVVIIMHDDPKLGTVYSMYAHLGNDYLPKKGDQVRRGAIIGRVGDYTCGVHDHLHFEIRTGAKGDDTVGHGYHRHDANGFDDNGEPVTTPDYGNDIKWFDPIRFIRNHLPI
jgi:murein DD-endopeptidase MepM/ murein hydrolase activator NlpD